MNCLHSPKASQLIQFTKKELTVFCEQSARVFSVSEYKHCALKSYAFLAIF